MNFIDNLLSLDFLSGGSEFVIKAFLVLFLVFYVVFVLILFRQIQLMTNTLPTPVSPFIKFLSILHIGIALAFLFIVIGAF